HLARAEAYRQQMIFRKAEVEYRAAMKLAPNDVNVHLELARALYRLHRYTDSLDVLKSALGIVTPGVGTGVNDGILYAEMARNYAQQRDRANASQAITDDV